MERSTNKQYRYKQTNGPDVYQLSPILLARNLRYKVDLWPLSYCLSHPCNYEMPGAISSLWRLFIMVLTALPHLRWLQYLNIWKSNYFIIGIFRTLWYFNIRMSIISKNCCPISASTPLSPVSGTPASISPMPSPLTRYKGVCQKWGTPSACRRMGFNFTYFWIFWFFHFQQVELSSIPHGKFRGALHRLLVLVFSVKIDKHLAFNKVLKINKVKTKGALVSLIRTAKFERVFAAVSLVGGSPEKCFKILLVCDLSVTSVMPSFVFCSCILSTWVGFVKLSTFFCLRNNSLDATKNIQIIWETKDHVVSRTRLSIQIPEILAEKPKQL